MQIRGSLARGLLISLALTLIPVAAVSAQKITPGSTCKVLKQKVVYLKKTYTCAKSGKKLVWYIGPDDAKKQVNVTPSPSPTAPASSSQSAPVTQQTSCPTPLLQTPVDLSKVTSILYPGQERGGNYKAHGGFGFDKATDNLVTVKIPLSGKISRVVRYREMGEVQYLFEFDGNCGVSFRFDHLRKLTPKFEAVVNAFPIKEDTRTDPVNPPVAVTVGEVIATEVGFLNNVSVDFGVYDMRQKNEASKDPAWASAHSQYPADSYGICWLNSLSQADSAAVNLLPSRDGINGKKSDYCK
jgi:hypothetical protein